MGLPDELQVKSKRGHRKAGATVVTTPRKPRRTITLRLAHGAIRLAPAARRRLTRDTTLTLRIAVQATPKGDAPLPELPIDVVARAVRAR